MFDKNIKPSCSYCHWATSLGYNEYFCVRRGIMNADGSCGKYRYEPTKRIPVPLPKMDTKAYNAEDFKI